MSPRIKAEERELKLLSPHGAKSCEHRGREISETPCPVRTAFQNDCHRVVHSKAFRRLKGKTQVFLWPEGDHYRTRLTHCQEVSQIARTVARALDLNEDLSEAIALAHDLGHTPFGHAGEEAMQRLVPGGFRHEIQSLRVVERLENEGRGLNLTWEVRDGIRHHSKGIGPLISKSTDDLPATLEGQIVRFADVVAYVNHDLDDAIRARVLDPGELPSGIEDTLGNTHSARLTHLVLDVIEHTSLDDKQVISMGEEAASALTALRQFLYERVYFNAAVHLEFHKASTLLERLWSFFVDDFDRFYADFWPGALRDQKPQDDVRDFLAGMTDAYAVNLHERIFTPRRWYIL